MSTDIDTADIVKHLPTGEEWLVAFVRDGRLWWCGWPEGCALLTDCVLVKKASDEERVALLRSLAGVGGTNEGRDARVRYARQRLQDEEASRAGSTG